MPPNDKHAPRNLPNINLQQLSYLEALVTERHVTRAAIKVGIGQPAMSVALAKLRKIFDDPLLVKTSGGMEPTRRAIELCTRIRETMDLMTGRDRAGQKFDPSTADENFRVMATDGISLLVLPELMCRVRDQAPGVQITFSPADTRRMSEYLRDGQFDLSIAYVRRPPLEVHQSVLYTQNLVCVARASPSRVQGRMSLDEFIKAPHVVWGAAPVPYPVMEELVDEALGALGLRRKIVLRVSNVMQSVAVVARTDLIAVIPERLALTLSRDSQIQIFKLPFAVDQVDVSLFWHGRWHKDHAHVWFRSLVREVGRELSQRDANLGKSNGECMHPGQDTDLT